MTLLSHSGTDCSQVGSDNNSRRSARVTSLDRGGESAGRNNRAARRGGRPKPRAVATRATRKICPLRTHCLGLVLLYNLDRWALVCQAISVPRRAFPVNRAK